MRLVTERHYQTAADNTIATLYLAESVCACIFLGQVRFKLKSILQNAVLKIKM